MSTKSAINSIRYLHDINSFVLIAFMAVSLAAVQSSQAAQTTPTSITITWTSPGDDNLSGTAAQYDIRYSTSTITAANWATATQVSNEPTPLVAGTSQSYTITGLIPSTLYYIAVKAADEVPNWSTLSNVLSVSTLPENTPPDRIAGLTIVSRTAASMTLSWVASGDDGATGTATAYDIRYSTSLINDANWNSAAQVSGEPVPQSSGTSETFIVTGLQPNTRYYFAIKVADEVPNWSALSNVASGVTDPELTAPADIADLATGIITSGSVQLTWTAPGDDGVTGTAAQYDIRYATVPITAANWNAAIQVTGEPAPKIGGSAEAFVVTGLTSDTRFYFAVKTADEVPNWSGLSNVVSATTLDITPPAAIIDLTVAE